MPAHASGVPSAVWSPELKANTVGTVRYCVIGTGFAGTCALWHLVRELTAPGRRSPLSRPAVSIATVERGPVSGPGYPYAKDNAQLGHRCNNEASTMGIHGNDFVDWLAENKPRLVADHPELVLETHPGIDLEQWRPKNGEFYPRALFGLYLEHRFQDAVRTAREHGIDVRQYTEHEAVDGWSARDGFSVRLCDLATGREFDLDGLDRVLLSTGHWQSAQGDPLAEHPGYLAAPYPPGRILPAVADRVRRGAGDRPRVYVQGMGPSGIDAVMTLCDEGAFTYTADGHIDSYLPAPTAGGTEPLHIVVGSRSGFFPPVRGPLTGHELHHLTPDALAGIRSENRGQLRLEPVLDLLDKDLRRATDGALGWHDVEKPRFASAREKLESDLHDARHGNLVYTLVLKARRMCFYRELTSADKALYDRYFDPHFIRTAVPMPTANAEKLLALMDAGVLSTVQHGYADPPVGVHEDGGFVIAYQTADGERSRLRADCVVRAKAHDFGLERHPSPLVRNLLRRGEIVRHEESGYATGGLALDPHGDYRVTRRVGGITGPSPHLSSYGSPVRFWQTENNYAGAFVRAAEQVAADWAETARSIPQQTGAPESITVPDDSELITTETRS
ncbi:FAD/NAD(P)-binding protein [Streptomyces sp. ACT015]|uniref:FAD/NAD(P)-binding protein n=1 Tax=Streptomyces sp. ACT015 TaxID=3134807 RepID=UPI003D174FA2